MNGSGEQGQYMESAQTYFGKLQEAVGGRAAGRVWGRPPPAFSLHAEGMQSSKLGAPSLHPGAPSLGHLSLSEFQLSA